MKVSYAMIKFYLNDAQKRTFQEPYQYSELFTAHDSILIRESTNRARNLTVEAAQKEDAVSEFELPLNESHNESTKITYPAGQLEIGSVLARKMMINPLIKMEMDSSRKYIYNVLLTLLTTKIRYERLNPNIKITF